MRQRDQTSGAHMLSAALSGGFAAILGGLVFVGCILAIDLGGLRTLSAADGWVRPLGQFAGIVGCFGMIGFAAGPMVRWGSDKAGNR